MVLFLEYFKYSRFLFYIQLSYTIVLHNCLCVKCEIFYIFLKYTLIIICNMKLHNYRYIDTTIECEHEKVFEELQYEYNNLQIQLYQRKKM